MYETFVLDECVHQNILVFIFNQLKKCLKKIN